MYPVLLIWATTIALCLVLGGIHAQIWLRNPEANRSSGIFAALALCETGIALVELGLMHAGTLPEFLWLLRVYYLLALAGFVALVQFAWTYLKAGRRWLGRLTVGLRAIATAVGLWSPNGLHFSRLDALVPSTFLGSPVVVPLGLPNPWLVLSLAAAFSLVAFFADAVMTMHRRGAARSSIVLGAMLTLFFLVAQLLGMAVAFADLQLPLHVTLSFLPVICFIGAWLGRDLVSSARLARELADAESRLLDSRGRLSMAAAAAKVSFWVVDRKTLRFRVVPMTMRLIGTPEGHTPNLDELLIAMHPADRGAVMRALADAPVLKRLVAVEYRVFLPDGAMRWYLSAGGGRQVVDGEAALMGMTMDITDRKMAEEAANRQREAIEHLSRAVMAGEMSGSLVQDLRQPLQRILDKARAARSLLMSAPRKRHEMRALLDEIIIASDGASQVISKLRQLLRRGGTAAEPVSLGELIDGVLLFLQADLSRRGVQVCAELDRTLRPVVVERVRIEQVVIHLIMNACDAMAEKPLNERELTIRVHESDGAAVLEFSDRGVGLNADGANVFSAFYTTKPEGAGMGLAICKSIVESHHGRIWAENAEHGGARFCVRLPFMERRK